MAEKNNIVVIPLKINSLKQGWAGSDLLRWLKSMIEKSKGRVKNGKDSA